MQTRKLGRCGLQVSVVGFGCGTVGGLMTRGTAAEQERAVARAIDLGVTYFDTAAQYGEGASEEALGRALTALRAEVIVATKVKVPVVEPSAIGPAIIASLEASLRRLARERVDLLQLHSTVGARPHAGGLTAADVLSQAVPAFQRLQRDGKIGDFGMTALGETAALVEVVQSGCFTAAQVPLNLLNPTPVRALPSGYPAQDYERLLDRMASVGMGGVCIRVLAAGALSGGHIHPLARGTATPMGSGSSFAADLARAQRFQSLVAAGHARSLPALAIRYALSFDAISTILIGMSGSEQIADAAQAAGDGPLPLDALAAIEQIQHGLVGEPR